AGAARRACGLSGKKNRTRSDPQAFMERDDRADRPERRARGRRGLGVRGVLPRRARAALSGVYLLTGDRSEADDLAQEALLRAYERWDRVGAMDSPAGYVYRTALNLHRSQLRALMVRARRVFAAIPADDLSGTVAGSHDARQALGQLPRGQRGALILVEG